jgi:DNA-binding NtrC family response regulator/tetratricopeptide (TPR) repeat protein
MPLVADRFVVPTFELPAKTMACDLATQRTVWLTIANARDEEEQRVWTLRCDEWLHLRYPSTAALIDYGLLGSGQRFEAWEGTAGRFAPGAGEEHIPGVQLIGRPSVAAIAEMLRADYAQRPRAAALWGPRGAGLDTAVLVLAREARLRGFVPIDASAVTPRSLAGIAGRSLFVIARAASKQSSCAFVQAALRSPRPHLWVVVRREECPGIDGFDIGRLNRQALIAAVCPSTNVSRQAAENAADNARGLPGSFVRILWNVCYRAESRRAGTRVAEQVATYDPDATVQPPGDTEADDSQCRELRPVDGGVGGLRQKLLHAQDLLAAGRHSPGLRLLRQSVAALARRRAWSDAAAGGLVISRELLKRGRAADAIRAIDEVRDYAAQANDGSVLTEAALLAGHAWIDLARLSEAECVLRAAVASARTAFDHSHLDRLTRALSRCLFWRGEHAEAGALLEQPSPLGGQHDCHRTRQQARIAAAQGDAAKALSLLDDAIKTADDDGDQTDLHHTAAQIRLMIGDLDGVSAAASRCLTAARTARRPMRVVSALLLQAEADRRRGLALAPRRQQMLARLARTATPLLRLRWDLIRAASGGRDATSTAKSLATTSGVYGLSVLASSRGLGPAATHLDPLVNEIVEIVRVCHDADEERSLLGQVSARVRRQLRAAAVAFLSRDGGRWDAIAADGAKVESDIAERVAATGIVIGPTRVGDRIEAGAPVQYGGTPIAALCARWTPGAGEELARAAAVLSVAASAAAPIVHAAQLHRHERPVATAPTLIGGTPVISDLRRAIERAGGAPFPVLIEGESGCGKELVARGIHRTGPRRDRAFCSLNCAALPDDLVESELFGHARGSFTGAMADRPGVFEEAHGGTLFLDEVSELSLRAQAKLLRVIQEGEIRRIGENVARRIDVRVVCATNRDLRRDAEAGRFRADLMYRLDVIRISVPPLRERRDDVAALIDYFWSDATRRVSSRATLSAAARAALGSYDWPGNVRELQNVLAALAVRSPKRGVVPPHALPPHIVAPRRPEVWRLDAARRSFEEAFVRAALVRSGGHRSRAAVELGVSRQGLNKLMSRLGIE